MNLRFILTTLLALALAAGGCSSDPGETGGAGGGGGNNCGGNNCGGGGQGGDSGDKGQCLLASSGGAGGLDCSGALQVQRADTQANVSNGADVSLKVSTVQAGGNLDIKLRLTNTNNTEAAAPVVISGVQFIYSKQSPDEADTNALACYGADGTTPCAQTQWRNIVPVRNDITPNSGQTTAEEITIRYTAFDNNPRVGVLVVSYFEDASDTPEVYEVNILTESGTPSISSVESVDFDFVEPGSSDCQNVQVTNVGDAALTMERFNILGGDFSLKLDGQEYSEGDLIDPDPDLVLEPLASTNLEVCFAPADDKTKLGELTVFTNDPTKPAPKGHVIQLVGNSNVPCMKLTPSSKIAFGGIKVGECATKTLEVSSCGAADLILESVDQAAGTNSDEFSYDFSKMGSSCGTLEGKSAVDTAVGPTGDGPCVLKSNEKTFIDIVYCPGDITETDPNTGAPLQTDIVVTEVDSNAYVQEGAGGKKSNVVLAEGIGVEETCPVAVVEVLQGEEVIPQTLLNLVGDKSYAPGGGTIEKYQWSVEQPAGSNQSFQPGPTFPNPQFLPNAAGEYKFCLEVEDANGQKSCVESCVTVLVLPEDAIHVELLWDTPADPDQSDAGPAAGADMDLHFAHPLASGPDIDGDGMGDPWFSNPFDTFWFNPNPNWGSANPAVDDDPSLDLDDTDGAGPENLNIAQPENVQYNVGVHYWNDHGYGVSYATVNIYILGILAFQTPKVAMNVLDMWFVGKINWPNTMSAGAGNPDPFEVCYQTPDPKKMWQPSGDWCITECYVNPAFQATTGGGAVPAQCQK